MAKKILVVDDENSLRTILCQKLKDEEFEVVEAKDGEEGLKVAIDSEPDLILLDILMPKMNGFEMTEKLRQYEKSQEKEPDNHIPIIYLTNLDEEKGLNASQKKGVFNYLVKSNWRLEDVVKRIKTVLKI